MPLLRERLLPSSVIYTSRAAGGVYSGELFPAGINLPGQTHVGSKAGLNMAIPEEFCRLSIMLVCNEGADFGTLAGAQTASRHPEVQDCCSDDEQGDKSDETCVK